jgi:hypothetical protein
MSRARTRAVVGGLLGLADEAATRKRVRLTSEAATGAATEAAAAGAAADSVEPPAWATVRLSSQRAAGGVAAAGASDQGATPAAAPAQVAEGVVSQPPVAALEALKRAVSPLASPVPPSRAGKPGLEAGKKGTEPAGKAEIISAKAAKAVEHAAKAAVKAARAAVKAASVAAAKAAQQEQQAQQAQQAEQAQVKEVKGASAAAGKAAVKVASAAAGKAAVKAPPSAAAAEAQADASLAPVLRPLRLQLVVSKHTEGWSEGEMQLLHDAVLDHGRDWAAVASKVGSRSRLACRLTALREVAAGRLPQLPLQPDGRPPKHPTDKNAVATSTSGSSTGSSQAGAGELSTRWRRWEQDELERLLNAVQDKGRDWLAVAHIVKTRSRQECWAKFRAEILAGRVADTTKLKRQKKMWTPQETALLVTAIATHGRNWKLVAQHVGSKSQADCRKKALHEVIVGRLADPGKKRVRVLWTDEEVLKLDAAVHKFGYEWGAVASCLPNRSAHECRAKCVGEIARGRMVECSLPPAAPPPPPASP